MDGGLLMKLKSKSNNYLSRDEFFCDLTDELDRLAGLEIKEEVFLWRHYVLADRCCLKERILSIRIPGGTVGGIWIDNNNMITKIYVDTNYIVKTYPADVNTQMEKFIGNVIEFE